MSAHDQLDVVLGDRWFHAIRFDDRRTTAGRFPRSRPANYTLFGTLEYLRHIDVTGLDCVDLGTMDGLIAFTLNDLGAGSVVATDMAPRRTFEAGRAFLGHDIDYRHPVTIDSLAHRALGRGQVAPLAQLLDLPLDLSLPALVGADAQGPCGAVRVGSALSRADQLGAPSVPAVARTTTAHGPLITPGVPQLRDRVPS